MQTAHPFDATALQHLCDIAEQAGLAILPFAQHPDARSKADGSPVTRADMAAHRVITAALAQMFPAIPVVSEEDAAHLQPNTLRDGLFFLVDPLDGTREFLAGNGEFTVNIALIADCAPVAGVVHAPASGETWWGANGVGAWKRFQGTVSVLGAGGVGDPAGWVVTGSRSHGNAAAMDAFLQGRPLARMVSAGSSLKFCRIAEGLADIYPRFGPTMEWDTAAGQAVLTAAGGWVCGPGARPLTCAKDGFRNPHFVAGAQSVSPLGP